MPRWTGYRPGVLRCDAEVAELSVSGVFPLSDTDRALANLARAQRDLTIDVLAMGDDDVASRLERWRNARPEAITRAATAVRDLTEGDMTVSRLSVAAGLLSDLARSA